MKKQESVQLSLEADLLSLERTPTGSIDQTPEVSILPVNVVKASPAGFDLEAALNAPPSQHEQQACRCRGLHQMHLTSACSAVGVTGAAGVLHS